MSTHPQIDLILEEGVEVHGEILNISQIGMHVRVPVHFRPGADVVFKVHNCTAKGQVLYCRPDGDQFFLAIFAHNDRRSEPRFDVDEPVTIAAVAGRGKDIHGRLVDVSRSGIGVVSDAPVEVGSLVEVSTEGSVLFGEIRNCAKIHRGEYRLGILAEETFAGNVREKHLPGWKDAFKACASRIRAGLGSQTPKPGVPRECNGPA